MIDFDFGPGVLAGMAIFAYLLPIFYSFFVDNYDKKTPQIRAKHQ